MAARQHNTQFEAVQAEPLSWAERNQAVIELGLAWLKTELESYIGALRASAPSTVAAEGRLADVEADWLLRTPGVPPRSQSEAAGATRAAYEAARSAMRQRGEPASIDRLSATFTLAPFDEDVVLLALAPHLDASFVALFGYAHDRLQLSTPTIHLVRALLTDGQPATRQQVLAHFSPAAPLRRFALLSLEDTPHSALASFAIDERLMRFLLGESYVDPRINTWLQPVPDMICPQGNRAAADELAARLRSGQERSAAIYGPQQSGRRAVAQRVAAAFGLHLVELASGFSTLEPSTRQSLLPLLMREAALGGFALLVVVPRAATGDPSHRDRLDRELARALLEEFDGICIVVAEERLDLGATVAELTLGPMMPSDLLSVWHEAVGSAVPAEQLERVAEQFRFGPAEVATVLAQPRAADDLWAACRRQCGCALEELAERIEPRQSWHDIVLPEHVLHDLRAIANQVRFRSQVYTRGGFDQKLPRSRGVTALLAGPSGVGKTLAAEVIAHDLGLDLCRIDLAGVVSKYVGETERHLKVILQKMEIGGAVLLFDECDALFGKRGEIHEAHDRYANLEVSYLLQRIESYAGVAILATNLKGNLDAAFLRRLRYVIDIPFPDATQRHRIWQQAFPAATATEGLDFAALARLEIPGGNISVISLNAAFLAAADRSPVRMSHIARAAQAEFRKIDKELRVNWQGHL